MKALVLTIITLVIALPGLTASAGERCGTVAYDRNLDKRFPQTKSGFVLFAQDGNEYVFVSDSYNQVAAQQNEARTKILTNATGKKVCVLGQIKKDDAGCFGYHPVIADFQIMKEIR